MTSNKITTTNAAELPSVPLFDFATFEELSKLAQQDPSYQFPIYDLSTSIPVPVPQNFLTEEEAFEKDCKELENLIDNQPREPWSLHAAISGSKYYWAREQINFFFENESERMVYYGSSSSDMRSHNLFRHSNGKKYVVHHSYGRWSDWFPLTSSEVSMYFDDGRSDEIYDDEMSPKTREFVESGI